MSYCSYSLELGCDMPVSDECWRLFRDSEDSSGKCSVLSRQRSHSRVHRDCRTGHSLGSGFLAWEIVSPLLRFTRVLHRNCTESTPTPLRLDYHYCGTACRCGPWKITSRKMSTTSRSSKPVFVFMSEAFRAHSQRKNPQKMPKTD